MFNSPETTIILYSFFLSKRNKPSQTQDMFAYYPTKQLSIFRVYLSRFITKSIGSFLQRRIVVTNKKHSVTNLSQATLQ